jgi:hypothetical protein
MRREVPIRRAGTHDALMGPGSAAHHARKRGALHRIRGTTKKQARDADLFDLKCLGRSPTAVMPMAVPMTMPADRGGLLRTILDRRSGAGVGQRQRLGGNGQDQQCADCSKSQSFRHVHLDSPPLGRRVSRQRRMAERFGRLVATQIATLE